jgi:geranylgeranyl diphosphate synthase type II
MAGGKRIRPVLCLLSARMHGLDGTAIMPFAGALECIHTYSLIHDDLPAMDHDDLRRGKPSNHKQFDEATAILAGDALLTDAFAFMAAVPGIPPERVLAALQCVAEAAGSRGMVGGQFLDMQLTAKSGVAIAGLAAMHAMKTGALLTAPCVAGAMLAGADSHAQNVMRAYGMALGAAFQIMDDILDSVGVQAELGKPVGSDVAKGKNTYPSLLGLTASRKLAIEKAVSAAGFLSSHVGFEAELLRGLAGYVVNRVT